MKYPKGKYSINVTASGKPDLPVQVQNIITISLIKPNEQDLTIGRFELTAGAEKYTTKNFTIDSEDEFQISFKKEILLAQTQSLQFDGVDDLVTIPFKTPLVLLEGTLAFWEAPAFSSSEQTSSQELITFYTTEGHRFEFAMGLLDKSPFFWFVWRRPDSYAIHINLFNPTFKARAWSHWAGSWKRSQDGNLHMEFYLNGELAGQNTVPSNSVSNNGLSAILFNNLEIGSMSNDWHFKGSIAEVCLYNKALLPEQFMQNPLKKNSSFLVGHWKLLGTCNQIVPDLTQNKIDGTLGLTSSKGADDPKCVKMKIPAAADIMTSWLKNVSIRKNEDNI
jgi:hypothetical protein